MNGIPAITKSISCGPCGLVPAFTITSKAQKIDNTIHSRFSIAVTDYTRRSTPALRTQGLSLDSSTGEQYRGPS